MYSSPFPPPVVGIYICPHKATLANRELTPHVLAVSAGPLHEASSPLVLTHRVTYAGGPAGSASADAGAMDGAKTLSRNGSKEFHDGIVKLRETPALRYRLLLVFGLFLVWL